MIGFSFKLGKDYAIDANFFYQVRTFTDGITFIAPEINLDLYRGDHKPSLNLTLEILNFIIFNVEIYNVHHVDDEPVYAILDDGQ